MARNVFGEIDLDRELEGLPLEGSVLVFSATNGKYSESVSKFNFTIVIIFMIVQVSIKYRDS